MKIVSNYPSESIVFVPAAWLATQSSHQSTSPLVALSGRARECRKNRKGKEEKRDFLFFAFKTFVTVPHFVLNLKLQAPCAAATVTRALYSFSALRFVPRRPMLPPPISRSCLWLKIFKKVKNCLTSRLPFARLSLLSTFATPSPIAISRDAIDRGNSTRG